MQVRVIGKQAAYRILLGLIAVGAVLAISQPIAAQSIVQGYSSQSSDLTVGTAVSLASDSKEDNPIIERATPSKQSRFVGIVVDSENTVASLPNDNSTIPVASSGPTNAYVNDDKGMVAKGDALTLSGVAGTLAKADSSDNFIVGTALEAFDDKTAVTQQISTSKGKSKTIRIAKQSIELKPYFRLASSSQNTPFIVRTGESLVGKPVSQIQAIAALTVFILVMVVEAAIIYASVRYSLISVGRNPLSQGAVYKQLFQIAYLTLAVFMFGAFIVYGILWI